MVKSIHLFASDYSIEESWRLVQWCMDRGADEFSIAVLHVDGAEGKSESDTLADRLRPHARGLAKRAVMTIAPGEEWHQEVPVHGLTDISLSVLKSLLPGGFFSSPRYELAWVEDAILYRRGEFML